MSEVIDQGAAVEEGQNLRVAFSTADIREPFRLSLGSYGRPRVTEELKELGLNVGQPPAGGIHHTGKGSQYCSQGYKKLLRRHGFKVPPLSCM